MNRREIIIGVATPEKMSVPYAYFAPAVALGYDRHEGLEFRFYAGNEPGSTARALCAGACDFACLNTIVGFMGRANDELPMLAIGSKARRTHRYFVVLKDSTIKSLTDLRGKKLACDFSHLQPLAEAALADEGVPAGTFQWVSWRGSGMEIRDMIEPTRRHEVDALFIMDWTYGDAVARGFELRHLSSRLLNHIRVSSCYWTTEKNFATNAEVLACALRAIQKSLVFSFSNPEAALRMMWEAFPETRPNAELREAVLKHDLEVLKACLEPMRIDAGDSDPRWCAIAGNEMAAWLELLTANGALRRKIDLNKVYTTALVDRVNNFDVEQIRVTARIPASLTGAAL